MQHVHFVGIGGAGLSALAQVMLGRGYVVSGSDPGAPNRTTQELERRGATIYAAHKAEQIAGADMVVVTSAAKSDNPEVAAAQHLGIPVLKRRDFLRVVTEGFDVIAIAGSHGKTTTTAMVALTLEQHGLDPTVVVGGTVPGWDTNARVGKSKWFVIEADEYDSAFLGLEPKIAVLTNVDYDHPDLFPTRQEYQAAFREWLKQTRNDGVCIVCGDEPTANQLVTTSRKEAVRYGMAAGNDWQARDIHANESGGSDFELFQKSDSVGQVALKIPGRHNVLNALAAIAASAEAGVTPAQASATLGTFSGVGRRFHVRGMYHGAVIIDDYAHHPTEIRASLSAARMRYPNARVWALFQPHTYSRTAALLDEFADAFEDADQVLITEIYAAREQNTTGLSGRMLAERMDGTNTRFVETLDDAQNILRKELRAGDVLMTLGAGNVNQVAHELGENEHA